MSHPVQYSVDAIRESLDRLADLHQEFRRDPDGLRWALEDELAGELFNWASSSSGLAGAQAFCADAAWLSLHAHRWWTLRRSSYETMSLLGPETVAQFTAEATRLEVIAVGTGDWAWAYDQLESWMRRVMGQP